MICSAISIKFPYPFNLAVYPCRNWLSQLLSCHEHVIFYVKAMTQAFLKRSFHFVNSTSFFAFSQIKKAGKPAKCGFPTQKSVFSP